MTTPDLPRPDISTLGYEQARDELAEVVRALEVGGLGPRRVGGAVGTG